MGYGASWKMPFSESPQLVKRVRKSRRQTNWPALQKHIENEVALALQALGIGIPPLRRHTPPPFETAAPSGDTAPSGDAFVEESTHGPPSPIDSIIVSAIGSTNIMDSTCLAY